MSSSIRGLRKAIIRTSWYRLAELVTIDDKLKIAAMVGYEPHAAQMLIHGSQARHRVVCCGRRFGKTESACFEGVCFTVLGGSTTFGAPTYDLCRVGFEVVQRMICDSALRELVVDVRQSPGDQFIGLVTGGRFTCKSYEKPRSWLARGRDFAILDEAAQIRDPAVYQQFIRPSLSDRIGGTLMISTPLGSQNFFKDEFDLGVQRIGGRQSFQFPSDSNPLFPPSEMVDARLTLPDRIFRQEYLAEFLEGQGIVFRGYSDVSVAIWQSAPIEGHSYVIGVDLAIVDDFTVICIMDVTTRSVAHMIRINEVDYVRIENLIVEASRRWLAPVIIDATNNDAVGHHVSLNINWATVQLFKFTATSKRELIHSLALAIEQQECFLLDRNQATPESIALANLMAAEFGLYSYERTAAGTLRLGAPSGMHDDIPTAVALAHHLMTAFGRVSMPKPQNAQTKRFSIKGQFG